MELIKKIFLSPEEARLRAGWRLFLQLDIWLILSLVVAIPSLVILATVPNSFNAVNVIANGIPFVLSVWLARRYIDRRSIRSLGLNLSRQAWKDLIIGIAIASVQILAIYLIEVGAGWLSFEGFGWELFGWPKILSGLLGWGVMFLAVGFYEELFSRGYQLQNIEEGTNLFWAVLLSSSFFGLMHLMNPGATWLSTLGIALAGLFFAFTYLRTRQLWLPIGIHIGWNFFLGPVFGFPVSGMETVKVLNTQVVGPELLTGGKFGPEAGLVAVPGLLVGVGLVFLYSRGRLSREEVVSDEE